MWRRISLWLLYYCHLALMEWLETTKKQNRDNESISNEVVAQAHLENYAFKLFSYADQQDRASNFSKYVSHINWAFLQIMNIHIFVLFYRNVVKAFYTAGMIYDVLATFGEISDENLQNRKYAKYKAAYIHNCLKNGETPIPGKTSVHLNWIMEKIIILLRMLFNRPHERRRSSWRGWSWRWERW